MPYDDGEMYDEGASSSSAGPKTLDKPADKSDETEDQLALVPNHFFKDKPKPRNREMIEIVQVYEGESSIKCVYDDKDKEEKAEGEGDDTDESSETDEMMM